LPSRLFVEDTLSSGMQLTLSDERTHYVGRVLRLKTGDALTLFDGCGGEFAATVSEVSRNRVVVTAGEKSSGERESPLPIHLVQAISRGERMDFVVQKATELGVVRVTPVMSEFSVVKLDGSKRDKRARHWRRIAQGACEQSGRNRVPDIGEPRTFDEWLQSLAADKTRLKLLLEPTASATLAAIGVTPAAVDLLVGPEGGLSAGEVERALAGGFIAVGFGPRILRTETAAIAAIAVLQARWGDLTGLEGGSL
jgi:16S rRNA (uracil1498-N3)-methyltransferase